MNAVCGLPSTLSADGATLRGRRGVAGPHIGIREVPRIWRDRRRYRTDLRRLLCLGPHLVVDIGLAEAEAVEEAGKPFWRA